MNRLFTFLKDYPSRKTDTWVALIFVLLAFAMRFFTFSRSVLDWDESTYLLIAHALLEGNDLYVDVWDSKPPGIFWLFAGLEWIFGQGVEVVRIASTLCLAGTAYWTYKLSGKLLPKAPFSAFFSGVFFLFAISFQSYSHQIARPQGFEANTEMFFMFFTAWAAYRLFSSNLKPGPLFIAGLLAGIAFIIKYFVLFDMLALGLGFLLLQYTHHPQSWIKRSLRDVWPLIIGCVLPFFTILGYYYFFSPNWEAFYAVTFELPGKYVSTVKASSFFSYLGDFFYTTSLVSFFLLVLIIQLIRKGLGTHRMLILFGGLWWGLALFGASFPGKFFLHYSFPMMVPLALLAGSLFHPRLFSSEGRFHKWVRGAVVVIALHLPLAGIVKYQVLINQPDQPRIISQHIQTHYPAGTTLYIDQYQHIIYYLTDILPLTKYYHPSLVTRADHQQAIGLDYRSFLEDLMKKKPDLILYRSGKTPTDVISFWENNYQEVKQFEEGVVLLERNK